MHGRPRSIALAALASLIAALTLGVTTAAAHGGPGGHARGFGGASVSALVTQAAKELGVTRTKLVTAIHDAAETRIAAALADGDVTADQADDLKAEAEDNLRAAYALSETKTVASNLGITATALNTAFRNARKALATAQIDKALAAGSITADEAAVLKAKLAAATLPGYKPGVGLGLGGYGHP